MARWPAEVAADADEETLTEVAMNLLAARSEADLRQLLALTVAAYGLKLGKAAVRRQLERMLAGLDVVPDDGAGIA